MSQELYNTRPRSVWPDPEDNCRYAMPVFGGQTYISTGTFALDSIDRNANENGRTEESVVRVTSLFFDADLVQLWQSKHLPPSPAGQKAPNAKAKKALMYAESQETLAELTLQLHNECGEAFRQVFGCEPTAVIDSGWGRHYHIAVPQQFGVEKAALKELHQYAQELLQQHVSWPACWDKTQDVGARICRLPGSINTKCDAQPRVVALLAEHPDVVLTSGMVANIIHQHNAMAATKAPTNGKQPKGQNPSETVDFNLMECEGETWQAIVDRLDPGEKEKVICPFGGTSIGSGFFKKEEDGRTRYFSGPRNTTYWNISNIVTTPPSPGRAQLARAPGANGMPGAILPTISNLITLITQDARFNFWFDNFDGVEMNGDRPVSDHDYLDIIRIAQDDYNWLRPGGKDIVNDAIQRVCNMNKRNPVIEYLNTLIWDKMPRLDTWLHRTTGAEQTPLIAAYSRRWAIGLIARVAKPGCKLDTVLTLKGVQGMGKSTICRVWTQIGDKCYTNSSPIDMTNKDAYEALRKCWIYEDAEMASGKRADEETKKRFLTTQEDTFRPPYGRRTITLPRHSVFVSSTNEGMFLKDPTGSRRYWVVECPRDYTLNARSWQQPKADLDWLRENRDQLLAEAVTYFLNGEQWWLTAEEEEMRDSNNETSTYTDYYTECATQIYNANYGGKKNRITVKQFAMAIVQDKTKPIDVQRQGLSLGAALINAGFIRGAGKINGVSYYYKYLEGEDQGVEPMPGNGLHAVDPEIIAGNFHVNSNSFR